MKKSTTLRLATLFLLTGLLFSLGSCSKDSNALTEEDKLIEGTDNNAQTASIRGAAFETVLNGDQVVPAVSSNAFGKIYLRYDDNRGIWKYSISVQDLPIPAEASLYYGSPGQNGSHIISLGRMAPPSGPSTGDDSGKIIKPGSGTGIFSGVFARGTLTDAELEISINNTTINFIDAIQQGMIYTIIETKSNPGGEIRGQF